MISFMISPQHIIYDIIHDIWYDIIHKYAFPSLSSPVQRADETDDDREPDRPMDFDEERDFDDQGPLTEMDMKEPSGPLCDMISYMI